MVRKIILARTLRAAQNKAKDANKWGRTDESIKISSGKCVGKAKYQRGLKRYSFSKRTK